MKSIFVAVLLVLATLTASSAASSLLSGNYLPSAHTVKALPGPPVLGIDCALGNSADAPNPFPTPISTKDSDGVIDSTCQWTGDFDGDPAFTMDPLVSDSPETAAAGLGGGVIMNVLYTNGNNTINAFDVTLQYNPAVLNFVQFDQIGLLFGGNAGCPAANPSCTLGLANTVDRVNGVVRLAQAIESVTTGGSPNTVEFFRMRFDVVGAGNSALTFTKSIVTFAVGLNTGPEAHNVQNGSFNTYANFLFPTPPPGTFDESWSFSPNPEVPFFPITFSATAASCSYCTAPFTYNWDFSSFDSSGYIAKVNATGQTVIVTAPPQAINRVTLTVTDSAAHSITAVRRLPLVGATQGPATAATGTVSTSFKSGYLGGVSAECSGATCAGTGSSGFSGSWRFCPGNIRLLTVCSNPFAAASTDPSNVPGITWNFAGVYNTVFSVTDSSGSQLGGPQTTTQAFPVNVTGTPAAYTVTVTSDKTSINAGSVVNVTAVTAYATAYPLGFMASLFTYVFHWGDGSPDTTVSGTTAAFALHTYAFGGSFVVRVTPQESAAAAPTSIKENGFSPVITVFDYGLQVTPNPITVVAGSGTTASLSATLTGGASQSVSFVVTGQPAGTTVTLAPTSCALSCTSQVNVVTTSAALAGTAAITITGTASGGLIKTTAFNLKITLAVAINCPSTGTVGVAVTCTVTTTGGTAPVGFAWTATGGNPASGTAATFTTTYSTPGPQQISVTATDSAPVPNTGTASATVTISAATPFTVTMTCPLTGTVGTAVACTATSSGGTGVVTFSWTATGGSPASGTGASFSATYSVKGAKTISVTGTDSATPTHASDTKSASVTIAALALSVTPTVPTTGTVGSAVSVSATATGGTSPYTFSWDFGDGSAVVMGATVSHTYTAKNTFVVKVTVTDANSVTASNTASITVSPLALATDFTFPATITPGAAASFTATTTGGTAPYTYAWTFGDGATGTGNPASHSYSSSGPFTVSVTATDANAKTATASHSVGQATPLTVTITCPTTGTVGTAVACNASSSGGTGTVTFAWTATGGSPASGTGSTFSTTYNVKGSHSISVTGTDSATPTPNTQTKSASVLISALALTVTPTVPATGTVGTSVSVSATASGGTSPYTFSWDFGDATAVVPGATATHTYTAKGTFTVKVTVTDMNAVTVSNTASITIAALTLATDWTISPTTVTANTPITFTATTTGGTSPYGYAWAFGDGTTGTTNPITHTYTTTGPFTVVLTVTDANTKTATATHTIGSAPPFTVTITCPTTGTVGAAVNCTVSATGGTTPYTFAWTATGGSPASGTGATFSTTYSVKGMKTISVAGTDSATPTAATDTKSASVNIAALALTVTPTVPTTGTVGTSVSVSATATGGTSPYTFTWDFGDGSATVTGASASHTYTAKNTFVVKVTVLDANVVSASNTASITVSPLALATDFTFPATITPNVAATFTATTTGGTAPYTYAWTFGDGGTGTTNPVSHTYASTGPFTVVLTVTDANAKTATATHTVGSAPVFTVTINCPATGTVGTAVACTASSSGGTGTVTFAWTATGGSPASGTGSSFSTTYNVKGTVTISVIGTDSATPTPNIQSKSASVIIAALALTTDFTASPTPIVANSPVTFTATTSGGTPAYTYSWTFGDTTTGTGNPAAHTYSTTGPFTVVETVTDANGITASATHTIGSAAALAVTINCPAAGTVGTPLNCTATSTGGTGTVTFSWTATGGTPSSGIGASFTTTYSVKGTVSISVTGTDSATPIPNTQTKSASITMAAVALSADFTFSPTTPTNATLVTFTATVTGGTAPNTYTWSFGDTTTGTGNPATHTYVTPGTFIVMLTVTDMNGVSTTATHSVTVTSTVTGKAVMLTFQAFDIDDCDNGVGQLNVSVNGHMIVNLPPCIPGGKDNSAFENKFVSFGPFDITAFVVQGMNTVQFTSPPPGHFALVKNVTVTQGNTILLHVNGARFVTGDHPATFTFSNPPLVVTSYTVNPTPVIQGATVTFTATFTGGSAPFACSFTFGDGAPAVVATTSTGTCSATHSYDDNGFFMARVKITGQASTDVVRVFLPVTVLENNTNDASALLLSNGTLVASKDN
ncbi:MAG TPA: PKD domain-containing protein [Candidatus Bathyarchaeia archaeon]|nr:PKD domain-containing protein [Candidatus Bathyarchaeia archaeon]